MTLRSLFHFVCFPALLTSALIVPGGASWADAPDAEPAVEVELLDAGREPRKAIRFAPTAGDKSTVAMTMKMSQGMTINGAKQPETPLPIQKFTMDINVNDVKADGDVHYGFVYSDIEVLSDPQNPSPALATIQGLMQPMVGSKGSGIVTNRGFSKKGEFEIPENLSPMLKSMLEGMKDSLNQLSSPVPGEAVGLGAKWRTVQNVNSNGIKVKQTIEHEVTAIDEKGLTTTFTLTQEAEPQELKNPGLPPGITIKLDSIDTKGSGTSQLTFDSIFPVLHTTDIASEIHMTISAAGQTQKTTTDLKMQMTLEPAKP